MKRKTQVLKILVVLPAIYFSCEQPKEIIPSSTIMFTNKPAAAWSQATPIGNGRLGGLVYGSVGVDTIKMNDDTFWSGEPRDLQRPGTYVYLDDIRSLLLADKTKEAQSLIDKHLLGPWNQSYMPLADLIVDWKNTGDVANYRRELDLNRGMVTITYTTNDGVQYKREVFASYPDQAIVMHVSADKKGSINFDAALASLVKSNSFVDGNQVVLQGNAPIHIEPNYEGVHPPIYEDGKGMRFESRLLIKPQGGTMEKAGDKLSVKDANEATFVFVAATSFNGFDKDPYKEGKDEKLLVKGYMDPLMKKSYADLQQAHQKDYSNLFDRVSINLGETEDVNLPIDERIEKYKAGQDPALTSLYFQFGRYLLISSSRPGSQPANLQGIWNHLLQPGWSANWTINCNAEINYWIAGPTNLSECHLPMIDMIREASVDGAKTAKNLYNSRGWMAHHNLDIWRTTWMVGGSGLYSLFQVGGAWLCQHIWDQYEFTKDLNFLNANYDLLKNASLFYLDNLQKDNEGYLVTIPSESFENGFIKPDGTTGWACVGSAQDMQIIRALFENTMSAAQLLGDVDFKSQVQQAYEQLAPMKISPRTGQLQEWNDDWEPSYPMSGQVGHGWAFGVGNQITLRGTPELAQAFRKTIEYRRPGYSYNSGSWTGTFPAVFWARFEEADSVQRVVDRHFDLALFPNLACNFTGYWEIDGNLGITAAITEMLLQSHAGEINLLPALPQKYPDGFIKGLKARGDYEVDLYWKDNKLEKAIIKGGDACEGGDVMVRYGEQCKPITIQKGASITLTNDLIKI